MAGLWRRFRDDVLSGGTQAWSIASWKRLLNLPDGTARPPPGLYRIETDPNDPDTTWLSIPDNRRIAPFKISVCDLKPSLFAARLPGGKSVADISRIGPRQGQLASGNLVLRRSNAKPSATISLAYPRHQISAVKQTQRTAALSTIARRSPFAFCLPMNWTSCPDPIFCTSVLDASLNHTKDRIQKILPCKYFDEWRSVIVTPHALLP
jgi:hypothetical protein